MHRITRIVLIGGAVTALAACSHHNKNAPLSYVPADTPYVVANLKPLSKTDRHALFEQPGSSAMRQARVQQVRGAADKLAEDGDHDLANLFRAFADSVDGKSVTQIQQEAGIDPKGLFALYGLGLSPVARGQLSDPDKFNAYVAKLEKAYGHKFARSTLDKVTYRHATLGDSGLQVVIATHGKQFIAALLAKQADQHQLRLVLGLDHPKHSAQDKGLLQKVAKDEGYGDAYISYLDTTALPALIAGGKDPLLKPLFALSHKAKGKHQDLAKELPASCKSDLARIAARVPRISAGYTSISAHEQKQQLDVELAPDIVKAFAKSGTHVPGLGKTAADAQMDFALAIPLPAIRKFWMAQAEAVQAHPFTCPALTSLNKSFHGMQKALPKTAMPPFGNLRGVRVVIDHMDLAKMLKKTKNAMSEASGRILIATTDPAGLLAMAKGTMPPLASLDVPDNGKPVKMPQAISAKAGQPAWIAQNSKAVAIGFGKGEKKPLTPMLKASTANAGTLAHVRGTGHFYTSLFQRLASTRKAMHGHSDKKQQADTQATLAATAKKFSHIKDIDYQAHMTDHGLRIRTDVRWK